MKFFAINGSPRTKCNTAQLLDMSLEGVKSVFPDAVTERIDLYNFPFHSMVETQSLCQHLNNLFHLFR